MTASADLKRGLRAELRRRRRILSLDERNQESALASAAARQALSELDADGTRPVASYCATTEECDLSIFHFDLWRSGRGLLLPRIAGPGRLSWHLVQEPDQLHTGTLNLTEPDPVVTPPVELPADTVLFVPGVGFTPAGQRLGLGGGYYDRVLDGFTGVAIGVCFGCQLLDELPSETHDRPVHAVLAGGQWVRALDP